MDIYNVRKEMKENNKTVFDMPLRVAYYARVSTDAEEQIHSLAAQKRHFEEYIANNPNWTLVKGYIDEHVIIGTSGKNLVKSRVSALVPFQFFCKGKYSFI